MSRQSHLYWIIKVKVRTLLMTMNKKGYIQITLIYFSASQSSSQQASTSFPLSKASSMRAPSFLIDRRLSEAEIRRRHMWLQKTRLSIASTRNRAKICYQVRFSDTLNGLYCAKYSPNGEIIVTSFGSGAIQVKIYNINSFFQMLWVYWRSIQIM